MNYRGNPLWKVNIIVFVAGILNVAIKVLAAPDERPDEIGGA